MNRNDRPGFCRDQRFDRCGIDAKRVGIDIGQHRRRPGIGNRIGGRDECQIGNDHLIARLQPQCGERQMKAGRAVADRERVFGPAITRKVRFELVDIFPDR